MTLKELEPTSIEIKEYAKGLIDRGMAYKRVNTTHSSHHISLFRNHLNTISHAYNPSLTRRKIGNHALTEIDRGMRPIYWGLVLTIAGIWSLALLGLVASYEHFIEILPPNIIINTMGYPLEPMPIFYIALMYIARFMKFFSLPFAIAIEARRLLKERKSEAKGNERGYRRQGRQVP